MKIIIVNVLVWCLLFLAGCGTTYYTVKTPKTSGSNVVGVYDESKFNYPDNRCSNCGFICKDGSNYCPQCGKEALGQ